MSREAADQARAEDNKSPFDYIGFMGSLLGGAASITSAIKGTAPANVYPNVANPASPNTPAAEEDKSKNNKTVMIVAGSAFALVVVGVIIYAVKSNKTQA